MLGKMLAAGTVAAGGMVGPLLILGGGSMAAECSVATTAAYVPGEGQNSSIVHIAYDRARQLGASPRAMLALFEAGLAESGFSNYANSKVPSSLRITHDKVGHDGTSVGYLQQQVGTDGSGREFGWGTVREAMDPAHATSAFLAVAIPKDRTVGGDAATLAQAVQASGTPDGSNYRAQEPRATAMLAQLATGSSAASPAVATTSTSNSSTTAKWHLPVANPTISSGYGPRPSRGDFHTGTDYAGPTGTPIFSIGAGVVSSVQTFGGPGAWTSYGRLVTVSHGNGVESRYAHVSAALVSEGQPVKAGEQIALVGGLGNVTGPHLHLEVRVHGAFVNPAAFLETQGAIAGPGTAETAVACKPEGTAAVGLTTPLGDLPPPPAPFEGESNGCTEDDPTTNNCVTPALLHLIYETQRNVGGWADGVTCWDTHGIGAHPAGRACDYTVGKIGTFPTGTKRDEGTQLAQWYVTYASQLDVRYVIYQGQIWSAARGWHAYDGAGHYDPRDPTGGHYDHVHVETNH